MRSWLYVALAACTPTFAPVPSAPEVARNYFTTDAYPLLLAHYGFGSSCASIQPATTFPAILCSPDPYDSIATNATVFESYDHAWTTFLEGPPPDQWPNWSPDDWQHILYWLDLEDAACRWGCSSDGFQ